MVTTHVYYTPDSDTYTYALMRQAVPYHVAIAGHHHSLTAQMHWARVLTAMGWPPPVLEAWGRAFWRVCRERPWHAETVSVFTASKILGVTEWEVYRKTRRGTLPWVPGQGRRGRRLPREAVWQYKAQREARHASAA